MEMTNRRTYVLIDGMAVRSVFCEAKGTWGKDAAFLLPSPVTHLSVPSFFPIRLRISGIAMF
jgi:hypothetical protein